MEENELKAIRKSNVSYIFRRRMIIYKLCKSVFVIELKFAPNGKYIRGAENV